MISRKIRPSRWISKHKRCPEVFDSPCIWPGRDNSHLLYMSSPSESRFITISIVKCIGVLWYPAIIHPGYCAGVAHHGLHCANHLILSMHYGSMGWMWGYPAVKRETALGCTALYTSFHWKTIVIRSHKQYTNLLLYLISIPPGHSGWHIKRQLLQYIIYLSHINHWMGTSILCRAQNSIY